jgi:hypothetical protein
MASHSRNGNAETMHHNPLDALNWPVLGVSVASWPFMSWLLEHLPAPTIAYMAVSGGFMLFQICDKMGWLERFKRHPKGN